MRIERSRGDPAHQPIGGRAIAAIVLADGEQSERGPGNVAGRRADLIWVFGPAAILRAPPSHRRHRPFGDWTRAIGVADAAHRTAAIALARRQQRAADAERRFALPTSH
jgi:hypothetical protein